MNSQSAPKDQLLASLKHYTAALESKRRALVSLADSSEDVRRSIMNSDTDDLSICLEKRQKDCELVAHVCSKKPVSLDQIIELAQSATHTTSEDINRLARSLLAINSESHALTQQILSCQSDCEAALKTKLESVGQAIRQSKQRRTLDAAYGPAHKHDTASYLDKQR